MLIIVSIFLLALALAEKSKDHEKVTYGSAVKLTHKVTGAKLHSHEIQYASGSGQQSVTGFPNADDPNSYFLVKAEYGYDKPRGEPVECGSFVRLQHLSTGKYLHSHLHESPLSANQEISAFGEENQGDNWKVICAGKAKYWKRDADIRFTHGETGKYLFASQKYTFGKPIPGQLEISGVSKASGDTTWIAMEGIYFSDNPMFA